VSRYRSKMIQRRALFSKDKAYRYMLTRVWDRTNTLRVVFVMLNPSVAGSELDDPTIRVCMGRAVRMGCGGIVVFNLFGLVSTNPNGLYAHEDPIGPHNDFHLDLYLRNHPDDFYFAAWGTHGKYKSRDQEVIHTFLRNNIPLHAIRLTKNGFPCHPLRQSYESRPIVFHAVVRHAAA
jgi:hypothetical protein